MNKVLVIYYTRTGTSRDVAKYVTEKLDCDLKVLTDNISWSGFFGFLYGGRCSAKRERIGYSTLDVNLKEYDKVYFVIPVWAGVMQPTVRTFIEDNVELLKEKTDIIFTAGGKVRHNAYDDFHKYLPLGKCIGFSKNTVKSGEYKYMLNSFLL